MINNLDEFKNLPGNRPDYLYKYRSLANDSLKKYVGDIFVNSRLYHCATKDFNDPFEAVFYFKLRSHSSSIENFILNLKNFSNLDNQDILFLTDSIKTYEGNSSYESLEQIIQEKIQEKTTVLSLCESYQNILMWSHYADSHKGICIEFDVNVAFEYWKQILPMQYVNEFPYVINTEISVRELSAIYLSKSNQWAYEKEWRFINLLKKPGLLEFPEESISGVILGSNISQEDTMMVKDWVKSRKRKPIILKTFIDGNSYSLGVSDIIY